MFRWVKKLTFVLLHICQTKNHESQIIHLLPPSTRFSLSVANYSPISLDDTSSSPSLLGNFWFIMRVICKSRRGAIKLVSKFQKLFCCEFRCVDRATIWWCLGDITGTKGIHRMPALLHFEFVSSNVSGVKIGYFPLRGSNLAASGPLLLTIMTRTENKFIIASY